MTPIDRFIIFAKKNSDEIKENKQLERLLGNFNYLKDFYKILQHSVKPLYEMLNKNPSVESSLY